MTIVPLPTQYAPAERASAAELQRQIDTVAKASVCGEYLDAIPDILVVLNRQRQIVFCNQRLLDFLGLQEACLVHGYRPGEALRCVHAADTDGGCGTSAFCTTCGAVRAILGSQGGQPDVQDCRITQTSGEALDLRVWTRPVAIGDEPYTIFTVLDIHNEKRRRALERIFFHDVLNTAANLHSYSGLLKESQMAADQAAAVNAIHQLSVELIEEVRAQSDLLAAENHELALRITAMDAVELLQDLARHYSHRQQELEGQTARVAVRAEAVSLVSDRVLLRRVLGNMLKNALEACQADETVTLTTQAKNQRVIFTVHNPGVMPPAVQLQIFQRSYSTKGPGHGLGTYSMKLLGERYLQGMVTFTSSAEAGTTFTASFPVNLMEAADPTLSANYFD